MTDKLYKKIKEVTIEMTHENGESVVVGFMRPDKMKGLLRDNKFLYAIAEKLDKHEL